MIQKLNIELIPAIDIIDGKCVRLTKGDYSTQQIYANDPVAMAQQFEDLGFQRLHMVDLDGAKSKHVVNDVVLRKITAHTKLIVDFGGGVKGDDDLEKVFDAGATLITAGSIAVTEPETYLKWLQQYGAEHLILGADVRNGKISINGWLEDSEQELTEFLARYIDAGTKHVLCTEISKDGTLQGPAIDLYRKVMQTHPTCKLIASGGVSCIEDLIALQDAGIPAVVFGKAIYEGRIDMKQLAQMIQ